MKNIKYYKQTAGFMLLGLITVIIVNMFINYDNKQGYTKEELEKQSNKEIEKLSKYIQKNEEDIEALMKLGETYGFAKKFPEAIEVYNKALKLDSENEFTWYSLGLSHENLGQFKEAIDMYHKSLEYDKDAPTTYRISLIYINLEFEKAIEYGEKTYEIIQEDPKAPEHTKEHYKNYVRILKNIKNQTKIENIVEANIELIDSIYTYPILHKEIMIERLMEQVEKDSDEYNKLIELKKKVDSEEK